MQLLKRLKNIRKKKMLHKRKTSRKLHTFLQKLLNCPSEFYDYTKMKPQTFFYLLNCIRQQLLTTNNRDKLTPEEKLFLTLRYLSSGVPFRSLAVRFKLSTRTPGIIINDTCDAIWNELVHCHMPYPTMEQFYKTSQEFEWSYDFPNCIGCIDCKYIRVKDQNDNDFPTYLQVIVDANCRFTTAEVITNDHDKIFSNSDVFYYLESKSYNIPPPVKIPPHDDILPFVLLGKKGYPLKQYLLKPYRVRKSNNKEEEQLFNDRLTNARYPIDCAFLLLTYKWRCLNTELQKDCVSKIVKVSCLLHNITIDKEGLDTAAILQLRGHFRNNFGLIYASRKFNSPERGSLYVRNLFKQYITLKYPRSDNV